MLLMLTIAFTSVDQNHDAIVDLDQLSGINSCTTYFRRHFQVLAAAAAAPAVHSSPLRHLTKEKWIPAFWIPILDILDFQQPVMIKEMRTVQALCQFLAKKVVRFCFKPGKMGQKLMKLIEIVEFPCFFVMLSCFATYKMKLKHYKTSKVKPISFQYMIFIISK